jgi:hypothetical protein
MMARTVTATVVARHIDGYSIYVARFQAGQQHQQGEVREGDEDSSVTQTAQHSVMTGPTRRIGEDR